MDEDIIFMIRSQGIHKLLERYKAANHCCWRVRGRSDGAGDSTRCENGESGRWIAGVE